MTIFGIETFDKIDVSDQFDMLAADFLQNVTKMTKKSWLQHHCGPNILLKYFINETLLMKVFCINK